MSTFFYTTTHNFTPVLFCTDPMQIRVHTVDVHCSCSILSLILFHARTTISKESTKGKVLHDPRFSIDMNRNLEWIHERQTCSWGSSLVLFQRSCDYVPFHLHDSDSRYCSFITYVHEPWSPLNQPRGRLKSTRWCSLLVYFQRSFSPSRSAILDTE